MAKKTKGEPLDVKPLPAPAPYEPPPNPLTFEDRQAAVATLRSIMAGEGTPKPTVAERIDAAYKLLNSGYF